MPDSESAPRRGASTRHDKNDTALLTIVMAVPSFANSNPGGREHEDRVAFRVRLKSTLLWFLNTGLLAVANHFYGNFLTDWAVEGFSILVSIPRTGMSDLILGLALLGAVTAATQAIVSCILSRNSVSPLPSKSGANTARK
jgi:hypothetical protein